MIFLYLITFNTSMDSLGACPTAYCPEVQAYSFKLGWGSISWQQALLKTIWSGTTASYGTLGAWVTCNLAIFISTKRVRF